MKDVVWMGSSLEDLCDFPNDVKDEIGFVLYQIQEGLKPNKIKHLSGIEGGVMEIISDYDKNAFRVVYATKIGNAIYVLHSFQKKSKSGISIPKPDLKLIQQRLKDAKKLEFECKKMRGKLL